MFKSIIRYAANKSEPLNMLLNSELNINFISERFVNNIPLNLKLIKTTKKENLEYYIIRDGTSRTWFFASENIFILHLSISNLRNFCDLYENSKRYKFLIYMKNRNKLDQDINKYECIVICISHVVDDSNYNDFIELNKKWSKQSSFLLFTRIGFFITLNHEYIDHINNERPKLMLVKVLGSDDVKTDLNVYDSITYALKWFNDKNNNLPYNHLILNT